MRRPSIAPIIELVPLYRCPCCPDRPRLYVRKTMRGTLRYLWCQVCQYRTKASLPLVCGSPTNGVTSR